MTANQMSEKFDILFDSLYEFAAPAYNDTLKSQILTIANNRVFFDAYYPLANRYRKGFEMDEASLRNLEDYIKPGIPTVSSNQVGVHPSGVFYDLPSDFLYAIEETVKLTGFTSETLVKPITHNEYKANVKNPYKKPYEEVVWRIGIGKLTLPTGITTSSVPRTELVADRTITSYRLRYLFKPTDIVVDTTTTTNQRHSYLNEMLQEKVVALAVKIASGAVKPEEYQIKSLEVLDSE